MLRDGFDARKESRNNPHLLKTLIGLQGTVYLNPHVNTYLQFLSQLSEEVNNNVEGELTSKFVQDFIGTNRKYDKQYILYKDIPEFIAPDGKSSVSNIRRFFIRSGYGI